MGSRALAGWALVVAAACVTARWRPWAGPDVEAQAGVPVVFGDPRDPAPEGAVVLWDFGDGTSAQGAVATHAFARGGVYSVRAVGPEGAESTTTVRVVPRRPAAAIPPDATAAMVLDHAWRDLGALVAVAEKLGLAREWRKTRAAIESALRVDPLSAEGQTAAGLDPEEGLALYTPKGDDDSTVLVVGVADEAAAERTVRALAQLLAKEPIAYREVPHGPGRLVYGRPRSGGPPFVYAFRHGYLALRLPADGEGDPGDSLRAWFDVPPLQGLDRAAEYRAAQARLSEADVLLYVAPGPLREAAALAGENAPAVSSRLRSKSGALALALWARPERITGRMHLGLEPDAASELLRLMATAEPAPTLFAPFPKGALGALHLALDPAQMAALLSERAGDGGVRWPLALGESESDGASALGRAVGGHVAVAAYLDVRAAVRSLFERSSLDASWSLVGALSLRDAALADRLLADAMRRAEGLRTDVTRGPEGVSYAVHSPGVPAVAFAVRGSSLFFSVNRELPEPADDASDGLAARLSRTTLVSPEMRARQFLWLDLAPAVDALTDLQLPEDFSVAQLFMLGMLQDHIERLASLSEAALTLWPTADGLQAELTIELR